MITERHFIRGGLVVLTAAVLAVGYNQTRARADGIPATNPLVYSGTLQEGGVDVTGMRNLRLTVWDDSLSSDSAHNRCITTAPNTTISSGRFQVTLDAACTTVVHSTPDLWIEVEVNGGSLGRTKIGAVPFAVEAARAADLTPAARNSLVPAGAVIAFGGTAAPAGWLLCDGSAVSRTTHAALFSAIGTVHGSGDGTTTFNLPDYRGRFLRGADNGTGRDPDRAARVAASAGGNIGDTVGSVEGFATAPAVNGFGISTAGSHTHTQVAHSHSAGPGIVFLTQTGGPGILPGGGNYGSQPTTDSQAPTINAAGDHTHSITGGDHETRPVNASVNWIIKF